MKNEHLTIVVGILAASQFRLHRKNKRLQESIMNLAKAQLLLNDVVYQQRVDQIFVNIAQNYDED